ncbi:hypothetical protein ES703_99044 [subsurface metagenome]
MNLIYIFSLMIPLQKKTLQEKVKSVIIAVVKIEIQL